MAKRSDWEKYWAGHPFPKEASSFLKENVSFLKKGKILNLGAMGGSQALFLASQGFEVDAMDLCETGVAHAQELIKTKSAFFAIKSVDLDFFLVPVRKYDSTAIVDFYASPRLFHEVIRGLVPGGVLLVEGWLIDQMREKEGPQAPLDEYYRHNELLTNLKDMRILFYDERKNPWHKVRCLAVKPVI